MISVNPGTRILVAVEPQDFRRQIDGLSRICLDVLKADPMSGGVFVFRSKGGNSLRLLYYDGQGFWMAHKRLSKGKFRHWPGVPGSCDQSCSRISSRSSSRAGTPPVAQALRFGDPCGRVVETLSTSRLVHFPWIPRIGRPRAWARRSQSTSTST